MAHDEFSMEGNKFGYDEPKYSPLEAAAQHQIMSKTKTGKMVPDKIKDDEYDRMERIYKGLKKRFKAKGEEYSPETYAAILGNFFQESRFDPTKKQDARKGRGIGIAQWSRMLHDDPEEDAKKYRGRDLTIFANRKGKKRTDLDLQLDFILKELKDHKWAQNALNRAEGAVTLEDAVKKFAGVPGKPGYLTPGTPDWERRNQAAYNILGTLLQPEDWGSEYGTIIPEKAKKELKPSVDKQKGAEVVPFSLYRYIFGR
jgi:hypothetical protein